MTMLREYLLDDKPLGRGTFGIVYQARDMNNNRILAIKVLHPALVTDPGFITRFQHEARLGASLSHPNIVQVNSINEDQGRLFLVIDIRAYTTSGFELDQSMLSRESKNKGHSSNPCVLNFSVLQFSLTILTTFSGTPS